MPLKGSFATLLAGTLIYVTATTAYGTMVSAFARTQIAALFGTAILTVLPATMFAGMMVPVSSLTGIARLMGRLFPMSYYLPVSVGTFTKGLGFADLGRNLGSARGVRSDPDFDLTFCCCAGRNARRRPMRSLANIFWLGTKELRSFLRDYVLLGLVLYASRSRSSRRRRAVRRKCTTPRSLSLTRTIRHCRGGSRMRSSRPIFSRRT